MLTIKQGTATCDIIACLPKERQLDIITRLPEELQLDIFDLLGYQDAIRLSQANRYFQAAINPPTWPKLEKEEFVFNAAHRWEKHNVCKGPPGDEDCEYAQELEVITDGHACFTCYRVRPFNAFSQSQITRRGSKDSASYKIAGHTRFCIDCGILHGKLKPGTVIRVYESQEWDWRFRSWRCRKRTGKSKLLMICGTCQTAHDFEYRKSESPSCDCSDWIEWTKDSHTNISCTSCSETHKVAGHFRCHTHEMGYHPLDPEYLTFCQASSPHYHAVLGIARPTLGSKLITHDSQELSAFAEKIRTHRNARRAQGDTDNFEDAEESMLQSLGI